VLAVLAVVASCAVASAEVRFAIVEPAGIAKVVPLPPTPVAFVMPGIRLSAPQTVPAAPSPPLIGRATGSEAAPVDPEITGPVR
jgi:hypothetical protein